MRSQITLRIDDKNLKRRLSRINNKIDKDSRTSSDDAGRYLRDNIRLNMPVSKGANGGDSRKSIIYSVKKHSMGEHEVIVTQGFLPHPDKEWRGKYFNLPLWMFKSPKALSHFRSGNISEMRQVVPRTAKIFNMKVTNSIIDAVKK